METARQTLSTEERGPEEGPGDAGSAQQTLSIEERGPKEGPGDAGSAPAGERASLVDDQRVWAASFLALAVADFGSLAHVTSRMFSALRALGIAGGAGIIITSAAELKRSKTADERLDATNSIAWGAQGLTYLVPNAPAVLKVGLGLGIVGSTLQTAVGGRRLKRGLSTGDYSVAKLGMLDIGAGLLWLTWELVGLNNPLFIGAYAVAYVGREAYASKHAFLAFLGRVKQVAKRYCDAAVNAGRTVQHAFVSGLEEGYASSARRGS